MARIRTIKPEFFRHSRLYDLEKETSLPIRLGFAGLFTCADREGRFRWEPKELKLDCLPYDDVDFSRVLDALVTRGFIVKYACGGREYGLIPAFTRHQVINNRESPSSLPPPNEFNEFDATATREPRDTDLLKGKGREGKGREEGSEANASGAEAPKVVSLDARTSLFRDGVPELRTLTGKSDGQARSLIGKWLKDTGDDAASVHSAIHQAIDLRPSDPIPWLERAMKARNLPPEVNYRAVL